MKYHLQTTVVILMLFSVYSTSFAQTIDLFEGRNASQDRVCQLRLSNGQYTSVNFKKTRRCDNDEAKSAVLNNMPRGRIIRLFDSPGAKTNDDWIEIRTNRSFQRAVVPTFESDMTNADLTVRYHRDNGLNGKVSRLIAGPPMTNPCDSRFVTIDVQPDGISSEGRVECSQDFRLELRIKKHVRFWFDKTLAKRNRTGNSINAFKQCRGVNGIVYAEFKVNGKKYHSARRSTAFCG